MPRRCNDHTSEEDPPRKKNCTTSVTSSIQLKHGQLLQDTSGKQWRLGKAIGVGGFGEIYSASDHLQGEVKTDSPFVAKMESHSSGPLFVEMHCYLRIAKSDMIEEWMKHKKIKFLGMPSYVASGSHLHKGEKYRFLVLPRFKKDLETVLEEKKKFNLKTVLTISLQIIDVLEYIHSKGYIHSDIKASNIMLNNEKKERQQVPRVNKYSLRPCRVKKIINRGTRNLRPFNFVNYVDDDSSEGLEVAQESPIEVKKPKEDQIYLLDYGLASKFVTSKGDHKPFCIDERKAHAGTLLFCSCDAHLGVPSRRSDLESLGYNMIYWMTGTLPWARNCDDPELIHRQKRKFMINLNAFLKTCFPSEYPEFLWQYFKYLDNLKYQEKPDYDYCKKVLRKAITNNGYNDDSCLDFDNLLSWRPKQKKLKIRKSENRKKNKFMHQISRPPLKSNIFVKPLLRKKIKIKNEMNWSKILVDDPEVIIKQAKERERNTEAYDGSMPLSAADLDIRSLNPTSAMLEVYNKCIGRADSVRCKGDAVETVEGYTPAMMSILHGIRREELEAQKMVVNRARKCGRKCVKRGGKKRRSLEQVKSTMIVKKEKKPKAVPLRRTYSLRG